LKNFKKNAVEAIYDLEPFEINALDRCGGLVDKPILRIIVSAEGTSFRTDKPTIKDSLITQESSQF
jgi:hypothetical protein